MKEHNSVYVIGFEENFSAAFAALLHFYDIGVAPYTDGYSFLTAAENLELDGCCILIAEELPDQSGLSLLRQLCKTGCQSAVIVLVDEVDPTFRQEALKLGAVDVIERKLAAAYLFAQLKNLLQGPVELPHTPESVKTLGSGTQVSFRMMRPEDAEIEQNFVTGLSERSRHLRFFSGIKQLTPFILNELTHPSFPLSYALIATTLVEGREQQIAVGRYAPTGTEGVAEFAVVVADDWHGHGIASELMRFVITAAAVGGIKSLEGLVLRENTAMLALARKLDFEELGSDENDPTIVRVVKYLAGSKSTT